MSVGQLPKLQEILPTLIVIDAVIRNLEVIYLEKIND